MNPFLLPANHGFWTRFHKSFPGFVHPFLLPVTTVCEPSFVSRYCGLWTHFFYRLRYCSLWTYFCYQLPRFVNPFCYWLSQFVIPFLLPVTAVFVPILVIWYCGLWANFCYRLSQFVNPFLLPVITACKPIFCYGLSQFVNPLLLPVITVCEPIFVTGFHSLWTHFGLFFKPDFCLLDGGCMEGKLMVI